MAASGRGAGHGCQSASGGAAKGIGKAITERLISDNYFVIAVDVDEKEGKKLLSKFDRSKLIFAKADICKEKIVEHLLEKIMKTYARIDVLVNNAGIIRDNMIWNMSVEEFDLRANAFLQHMVRNIIGNLVYIGKGKYPPEWMQDLLQGGDRMLAAPTFSPAGLYLAKVSYPNQWALPDFSVMPEILYNQ